MVGTTLVIVATVLIIAALVLLEFKDLKHRLLLVGVVSLFLFLVGSLGYVYFTNDVNVGNFDGVLDAVKLYFSWLDAFFDNLGDITTFAIKQDWTGSNSTVAIK